MLDLADQQGVRLPADTVDGLAKAMKIGQRQREAWKIPEGIRDHARRSQTEDASTARPYELGVDAARRTAS